MRHETVLSALHRRVWYYQYKLILYIIGLLLLVKALNLFPPGVADCFWVGETSETWFLLSVVRSHTIQHYCYIYSTVCHEQQIDSCHISYFERGNAERRQKIKDPTDQ
jgi:hypothetical protein